MKFLLSFFFFVTLNVSFGQYRDSYGFPLFEEVLSYLDNNLKRMCRECYYGIAKKEDGYYLVTKQVESGEISNRDYFKVWDAKQNKFMNPNDSREFLMNTEIGESGLQDLKNEAIRYDLFSIYGYPEWIDDLTNFLSSKKDLSLNEMEMLARANSEKASDYIHPNQYGNNFSFSKGLNDPMYEKIDPSRIDTFLEYANKSINYYLQIQAKDPNYKPIIIEDLQLKIDHDLMHYFEYLMSVKEPEKARSFLERVKYNDGFLSYASSILSTCPKNAILITYGDTDSYPLWYLQEKDGYRKDVTVLNNSLMQTAWYMAMAKERYGLKTSFTTEQYQLFMREYFIKTESKNPVAFEEWIKLIDPAVELALKKRNGGPATEIEMIPQIPQIIKVKYAGKGMVITPNNYYMAMLDLVMVDLIGNNPDRTIITTSPSGFYDLGLNKHFASRCASYELKSAEVENYSDDQTADWILKKMASLSPAKVDQMKSVGNRDLMALYDNVARLSSDTKKQQELFKNLRSTYTQEYLFSKNDAELIQSIEETYRYLDVELAEQLRESYAEHAIKMINALEFGGPNPGKELYTLEQLFRTYSGANYAMTLENVRKFNESDKKVLKAIQKKITTIHRDGSVSQLKWTSQRLDIIAKNLEKMDL
jgi:hypothetical protein